MSKGYVYVLSNPSMPGLVKIGHSINGGKHRANQLHQTGTPMPFVLEFEIFVSYPQELELLVHQRLSTLRISKGREFFKIDPNEAEEVILEVFAEINDKRVIPVDFYEGIKALGQLGDQLDVHTVIMCSAAKYISQFAAQQALAKYQEWVDQRASERGRKSASGAPNGSNQND